MDNDVAIAVERARRRAGETFWRLLSMHEQTVAIYRELRALDAERVAGQTANSGDLNGANTEADNGLPAADRRAVRAAE